MTPRATRNERCGRLLVLLLFWGLGCQDADRSRKSVQIEIAETDETHPVDKGLLARALRALEPELPQKVSLLEIRARPGVVELQLISNQAVTSLRYREAHPPDTQLSGPVGTVDPPVQVPVYGEGRLSENGFSPDEVDLQAIASAFPIAIKAVDPVDGWVRELVIRRFFPFGTAVRARIYVESPRMAGAIDTNGNGIPLRKGPL